MSIPFMVKKKCFQIVSLPWLSIGLPFKIRSHLYGRLASRKANVLKSYLVYCRHVSGCVFSVCLWRDLGSGLVFWKRPISAYDPAHRGVIQTRLLCDSRLGIAMVSISSNDGLVSGWLRGERRRQELRQRRPVRVTLLPPNFVYLGFFFKLWHDLLQELLAAKNALTTEIIPNRFLRLNCQN